MPSKHQRAIVNGWRARHGYSCGAFMHLVVHFQFRLAPGSSVGPALLKRVWWAAAQTPHIEVSRAARHQADGFIYSLSAPVNLADVASVETRLRTLLDRHVAGAVNTLIRLPGGHGGSA
ncbi:MAG TPA: hypothetical protein VN153_07505 [Tahibacter sp.]|nr:hypothetical protein [Tahibacter sp.]